jgi:hypothetical protein
MAAVSRLRRRGWPGEHRRVEEFVADVVFGAGIARQNHRRGGLRRVLDLAGDELAGDPRAAARQGALLSRGQDGDAAGQDLAGGAEEGGSISHRASSSGTTAPTASRARRE